ncbi:MAG TPA: glycosyl hydrolase family 8 [Candidatus Binatia bacterium]
MPPSGARRRVAPAVLFTCLLATAVPAHAGPSHPFGSHPLAYAAGSILPDHVSAAVRDQATADFYDAWKARFLKQGCGTGRYYVLTQTQSGNLTVSEGHGYGMLLTVLMAGHDPDAQTEFDGLFLYFRDHPTATHDHLMSWYQKTSCADAQGNDSATDGDLDIAFALLLADKQWGSCGAVNYLAEAQQVIADVKDGETDASNRYVLLGDWVSPDDATYYPSTRSSDFMVDHFRSYAGATGDSAWTGVLNRTYAIVDSLQTSASPSTGLLPDFVQDPLTTPVPAAPHFLESANDGAYDYNACRDPWRLATDYLVSGDARARTAVQRIESWVRGATGGDPSTIKSGYQLSGTMSPGADYLSMAFVAPLGVGAMVDAANQGWLDAVWDLVVATPITTDGYYENTLKMLALVVMSGNWWAPEAVAGGPCVAPTFTPAVTPTPTVTPTSACAAVPDGGCLAPVAPGAALVSLKDRSPDAKDQLLWKWSKGAATSAADLGDPLAATSYDLCVYDGNATLVAAALVPAGGTCSGRPCWKATSSGFSYTRKDLLPNGILKLDLRTGEAGRARITLKGKGDPLPMPMLPVTALPLTVELRAGTGTCWSATYGAGVQRNDAALFKARSD